METMKKIRLTQGKFALVDDVDYKWLNQWNWYFSPAHIGQSKGYAIRRSLKRKNEQENSGRIRMHRLIMKCPLGFEVDHIDHNGLNNQRSNLRICSSDNNKRNRTKPINGRSSNYLGVYWYKFTNKWKAQINNNGKRLSLGYFEKERHAAMAYDMWAKEIYGEYANLNFCKINNN